MLIAQVGLSRATFEALVAPTLAQSVAVCREVLADAELAPSALDAVLLIGGSARSAAVEAHAANLFGQAPLRTARPEEAIALGAAAHAQWLREQQFATA